MATEQVIAGRYQVQNRIGAGGMGTVFKGWDTLTKTPIAIKVLKSEVVMSRPDAIERFRREGQALSELNHPNIVKMLAYVEEDSNHYLIEEYLGGGDLKGRILDGALSIKEVLEMGLDLADALTRAHRLNIIHRDLKPANILLDEEGSPHLSDFGIALIGSLERVTEKGGTVGTADYMSPEMLRAEEVDPRTDVWSFGVLLFEMLTGKRPFVGSSLGQIITRVMNDPIPDLETMRRDAPVELVDLVYRMLEKDRHMRLSSVRVVGAELEAILRGRSTDALDSDALDLAALQRFDTPPPGDTQRHNNLPALTTPFVGRETEVAEVQSLIVNPDIRLITILAPGGMGKTRLALEVAQRQLIHFPNGAFFVSLAPLDDRDQILPEIAEAIEFQFNPHWLDASQQLLSYLHDKHMLLILDNFEHLIEGAGLVNDILVAAPQVTILVTSRQRLRQSGETVFNLEGMAMPDWNDISTAMKSSPVLLFLQGASRAQPSFILKPKDLPYAAQICEQVQGMPLGILLAASWVEMLTLSEIASEVRKNLDFLETDMADVPERQRSLRAVFDYSWNLMAEEERAVFMKLSVFRGGFTRQAAQAVTSASLRELMALMNKSLMRRSPENGRYWVHELLRQYAMEQLRASGTETAALEAHATYYASTLKRLTPDLQSRKMLEALKSIDPDFENMRYAGVYWVEQGNWSHLYEMLEPYVRYTTLRTRYEERNSSLKYAVDRVDALPLTHPFQALVKAMYGFYTGSHDIDYFARCLEDAQKVGTPPDIAYSHWTLGMAYWMNNHHETAMALFEQAREGYMAEERPFDVAAVLHNMSQCLLSMGDDERAVNLIEQSLAMRQKIGDWHGERDTLVQLGMIQMVRARYDEAEQYWQRAREIVKWITGDARSSPEISISLGLIALLRGDFEQAQILAKAMVEAAIEYNVPDYQGYALALLAVAYVLQGEIEHAQVHIHEMDSLTMSEFDYWAEADKYWARALVAVVTGDLETARHGCKEALNVGLNSGGTLMIWSLPVAALIAEHEERDERAVELIALSLSHPTSARGWLDKWTFFKTHQEALQDKLGVAYQRAWQRGISADLATVVAEEIGHLGE